MGTDNCKSKSCLHCEKGKPKYCEECYQELITKNARLQTANMEKSTENDTTQGIMKEKGNIYTKAINSYGEVAQILQSIEEMSELTKELLKNINRGQQNIPEIIGEIADVQIMLEQLILIYSKRDKDINEKVLAATEYKLLRLKRRME